MAPPHYKLIYFDFGGLAESIRLLLHYGGIKFEDFRFAKEDWPKHKDQCINGQVPVLEVDGKQYHQSIAIARCLAKKVKLVGADEFEDMEIDAIVDTINDLRNKIKNYFMESNAEFKESMKDPLYNETLPQYLGKLDKFAADNKGYLVLGKLTWADVYFFSLFEVLTFTTGWDIASKYPNLKKVCDNVGAIPAIKKWVEIRPKRDF